MVQSTTELTPQERKIAKERMDGFLKDVRAIMYAQGLPSFLMGLSQVSDKLARGDGDTIHRGWFGTYVVSLLSSTTLGEMIGAQLEAVNTQINCHIRKKLHDEFDSFPITERRTRNPEHLILNETVMHSACTHYMASKGNLIGALVGAGVFSASTVLTGGLANIPLMAGVMGISGLYSYFVNKRMTDKKIRYKNEIRKNQAVFNEHNRDMYANTTERETNDPTKKEYHRLDEKSNALQGSLKRFVRMLRNYSLAELALKTAIVGTSVALAAGTGATNMLVLPIAALSCQGAVGRVVNSVFSLKEHIGTFAHAYNSFKSKVKNITFGKTKVPQRANTIELDCIAVAHRTQDDITTHRDTPLFTSDDKLTIGKGITVLSGASGAGKSSLINMLMHSDDPVQGAIRIGYTDDQGTFVGNDYKELAFAEPARHIAISLQGAMPAKMTVDEYIRLANPNADEAKVQEVKELLGIREDGNPASISPSLEIRDNNLSGGQRNRLNVAQALIKDSPILILDEPTAGVDAAMSQNIVDYINKIKDEKTVVYITHHPEEIRQLEATQALDLDKQPTEATAKMTHYDLTDESTKEGYLDLFTNRKGSSERSENRVGKTLRELSYVSYASSERLPKTPDNIERRQRVAKRLIEARREEMALSGTHQLVRDTYPKNPIFKNTDGGR